VGVLLSDRAVGIGIAGGMAAAEIVDRIFELIFESNLTARAKVLRSFGPFHMTEVMP
jgi:hypothetical protein